MLISWQHRFAFIHVQKTAGLSIHKALLGWAPEAQQRLPGLDACRDPLRNRHLHACDLRGFVGEDSWKELFSFAFVRNPWDRLVSWYNMCLERPTTPFMHRVRQDARSFDDFLTMTSGLAERTTYNQIDYVANERGEILVDFVGRFEALRTDFQHVCDKIGMPFWLPHINRGQAVDYRSYYTRETRDLVAERFRRDIEAFGYEFGTLPRRMISLRAPGERASDTRVSSRPSNSDSTRR